ncbi:hypothetical protein [Roseibium sp.]|uniref:hypothetical protein n=1 Tax=Roseibium sp. TaxID=1936156 RepID=UPI003BAD14D0
MKKSWPNNLGDTITICALLSLGTVLGVVLGVEIADVDNMAEWVGSLASCAGVLVAVVIARQQLGPLVAEAKDRVERRNVELCENCAKELILLNKIANDLSFCMGKFAAIDDHLGATSLTDESKAKWLTEGVDSASVELLAVVRELHEHEIRFIPPRSGYTELSKSRLDLMTEVGALASCITVLVKILYNKQWEATSDEVFLEILNDDLFRKGLSNLFETYTKADALFDAYMNKIDFTKKRLEKLINEE